MSELPLALFLMGPTASGKTALALKIAEYFPVEIISVDSALVYREMDIGTSKPDKQTLKKYPHHLIDICDPAEAYSVAQFRNDAIAAMEDIVERGKVPLLAGGTMLYYRALTRGLSELPSANSEVRAKLDQFLSEKGSQALHERLRKIDPEAAEKIHPNDPQRLQRAVEVFEISGVPISEWWRKEQKHSFPFELIKFALNTQDRSILHQRIESRFVEMLDEGLVEEVEKLRSRNDLNLDKPSMRAVGYRQVWQYLDGELSYDEMVYKGVVATRQLAKRQLTWLRSEDELQWIYSNEQDFIEITLKNLEKVPKLMG